MDFVSGEDYIIEIEVNRRCYERCVHKFNKVEHLERVGRILTRNGQRVVRIYRAKSTGKFFWKFDEVNK